jgi:hypothetical protein
MKIAPVVAENKRRPIWGWSIQAKRTVNEFGKIKKSIHEPLVSSL